MLSLCPPISIFSSPYLVQCLVRLGLERGRVVFEVDGVQVEQPLGDQVGLQPVESAPLGVDRHPGRSVRLKVETVRDPVTVTVEGPALGVHHRPLRGVEFLVESIGDAVAVAVDGTPLGVHDRPSRRARFLVEVVGDPVAVAVGGRLHGHHLGLHGYRLGGRRGRAGPRGRTFPTGVRTP